MKLAYENELAAQEGGESMSGFDREALCRNMRVLRAGLGITQAQLAERMGINVATVNQYERGETVPGADKLCAMAEVLGCAPNDLLGWKKPEA